jgi:hypothetical protein
MNPLDEEYVANAVKHLQPSDSGSRQSSCREEQPPIIKGSGYVIEIMEGRCRRSITQTASRRPCCGPSIGPTTAIQLEPFQHVFPLDHESAFNADAPNLDETMIKEFHKDKLLQHNLR